MKKTKEKGSLLLETMISLALIGLVAVSVVGSTANINIGWRRLKAETNAYNTIYSTYQILRGLNSTSWLNDHLNENILDQFKTNYGSNTQFKLDFSDIQSIVVKGYDQKIINGSNNQSFQYYTYYIITYTLKSPSKTVKLPLTVNYIAIPKVGK